MRACSHAIGSFSVLLFMSPPRSNCRTVVRVPYWQNVNDAGPRSNSGSSCKPAIEHIVCPGPLLLFCLPSIPPHAWWPHGPASSQPHMCACWPFRCDEGKKAWIPPFLGKLLGFRFFREQSIEKMAPDRQRFYLIRGVGNAEPTVQRNISSLYTGMERFAAGV